MVHAALCGCWLLAGFASAQVMLERQQIFDPNAVADGDLALGGSNLLISKEGTCSTEGVFFYEDQGGTWTFVQQFAPDNCGSEYGESAALNGPWAFVSAMSDDAQFVDQGSVYVYRRVGSQWTTDGKLHASDASPGGEFGQQVAADGRFLVVGVPSDSTFGFASGKLYVFENLADTWTEVATLFASDAGPLSYFGGTVAIDDERIVAGATDSATCSNASGRTGSKRSSSRACR